MKGSYLYYNFKKFCTFSIVLFLLCNCNEVTKTAETAHTQCKCAFKINPSNFDSLHLSTDFDSYKSLISIQKNDEAENYRFKGVIESIEEISSEINTGFDETKEDLQGKTVYIFNKKGLLDKTKQYSFSGQTFYLNLEKAFSYYANDQLANKTTYYNDRTKVNERYTYGGRGLKIKESLESLGQTINCKTNYYTDFFEPDKQVYTTKYDRFIDYRPMDSTVVRYFYDTCRCLNYFNVYNADGKRKSEVNFIYSEKNHTLSVITSNYDYNDQTAPAKEIIFYMDSSCNLKEITEVEIIDKNTKEKIFSKLSLNKNNDITEIKSFKLKTPNDEGLDFIRELDNYNPEFLERRDIQIRYDSKLNWVEKKINNEIVIRRKIKYQK
jgi:hypothetical protein